MVLTSVKMKFVDDSISKLPNGEKQSLSCKRIAATRFEESGKVDHTAEFTIFGQIMQQIKKSDSNYGNFRQNSVDDMAYSIAFKGEGSMDVGGPYRESLTNIVAELEKSVLPIFVKTANNRNDHGDNRECFVVNSNSKTPTHAEMFKFVGVLIGYAFRSKSCMPFNLAPSFWKLLIGTEL